MSNSVMKTADIPVTKDVPAQGGITIYGLAFVAGAAGMALEILGSRILTPYFGSSVYVWGALISVFMVSLSAGYILGGKVVDHALAKEGTRLSSWPVAAFLASAALVAVTPFFGGPASLFVSRAFVDARIGALVASTTLFAVPTVLLGSLSPYLLRLLLHRSTSGSGVAAGRLSAASTLGSVVGTVGASFYLLAALGCSQSLWALAACLAVAGLVSPKLLENSEKKVDIKF